jgi:hypothetical protein
MTLLINHAPHPSSPKPEIAIQGKNSTRIACARLQGHVFIITKTNDDRKTSP